MKYVNKIIAAFTAITMILSPVSPYFSLLGVKDAYAVTKGKRIAGGSTAGSKSNRFITDYGAASSSSPKDSRAVNYSTTGDKSNRLTTYDNLIGLDPVRSTKETKQNERRRSIMPIEGLIC